MRDGERLLGSQREQALAAKGGQQVRAVFEGRLEGVGKRRGATCREFRKGEQRACEDRGRWKGEWSLRLAPVRGPSSHMCTSTSSSGAGGLRKTHQSHS